MKYVLTLLLTLALAAALPAAQEAYTTPQGLFFREMPGEVGPVHHLPIDDPAILWTRNLATGIFNSTAITTWDFAYTGSGLNDPREAARYEILGNGEPVDTLQGTEWEVAAAPHGGRWAAVDRDAGNNCTLYLMTDSTELPTWTYSLGWGGVAGTDGMQFSDNGEMLVVWFTRAPQAQPRLLAWDLTIPDTIPLLDYEAPAGQGTYARALEISADGSILAATADNFCHIVETDGGFVRDVVDFQASNDALALSADGNLLMSGFQGVKMYSWDGTHYTMRWQAGMNNRYVGQLIISPDTSYCVSCWYSAQYDRNYIRVHDVEGGVVLWSYSYHQGTGLQDLPVDADVSADGNWFAVGSWGDQGSQNGEVVVFSRYYPTPYYELDMAGSCFSLDLSADAHTLIAAGKHVHANQFGNGGDAYCVDLDLPPAEPIVGVPDDEPYLLADTVCNCGEDTVTLGVPVWNRGYAPLTIESFFISQVLEDTSFIAVDSSMFGAVIAPGDTIQLHFRYWTCNAPFAGFYDVQIVAMDSLHSYGIFVPIEPCGNNADESFIPRPSAFALSSYPNPFNSTTTISFDLPVSSDVRVSITNILGRELQALHSGTLSAGNHHVSWEAADLPSGVYFVRLESHFGVKISKLLLLK